MKKDDNFFAKLKPAAKKTVQVVGNASINVAKKIRKTFKNWYSAIAKTNKKDKVSSNVNESLDSNHNLENITSLTNNLSSDAAVDFTRNQADKSVNESDLVKKNGEVASSNSSISKKRRKNKLFSPLASRRTINTALVSDLKQNQSTALNHRIKPTLKLQKSLQGLALGCYLRMIIVVAFLLAGIIPALILGNVTNGKNSLALFIVFLVIIVFVGLYDGVLIFMIKKAHNNIAYFKPLSIMAIIAIMYLGIITFASGIFLLKRYSSFLKSSSMPSKTV